MDPNAVVSYQIEDGQRFLSRLAEAGIEVTVAGWVRLAEDDRWRMIVATPVMDRPTVRESIGAVNDVFRTRPPVWFTSDDLRATGPTDPKAVELLRVRGFNGGGFAGRYRPDNVGGWSVREVYVYPERLRIDLTEGQKQLLADLYARSPLSVDALPYTDEMDRIHFEFVRQTGIAAPIGDLFRALLAMRKQSRIGTQFQPSGAVEPSVPAATA